MSSEDQAAEGTSVSAEASKPFVFSSKLSLEDVRSIQAKFAAERNWEQYHTPRNLLLAMVGEVGELSELFQWRGEVGEGLPKWLDSDKEHLGQELSDVLIYLIRLAERCHIDLPSAVLKKFELNAQKYPVDKAYGRSLKYSEYRTDSKQTSKED
ncbi:dCTP pyrophosphatase 1-like [Halichondria panicea]|uniref:dCTP pyrophosphatase 1-like n=1 Tax=Halichondria panicea TaxID=6063 RepID=UPI00312BA00F